MCRVCGDDLDDDADFIRRLCGPCLYDELDACDACEHPDHAHDPDDRCELCLGGGPCE